MPAPRGTLLWKSPLPAHNNLPKCGGRAATQLPVAVITSRRYNTTVAPREHKARAAHLATQSREHLSSVSSPPHIP